MSASRLGRLVFLNKLSLVLAMISLGLVANADPRTQYGWGIHDLAVAGSDRSGSDDGMTVVQNPAAMLNQSVSVWSANLTGMTFQFPDLGTVVTDSPNVGASSAVSANVPVNPDSLYMFQLGVMAPFGVDKKWRFGFAFSVPVDRVVDVATQNGYSPGMAFYGKPEARLTSVVGIARQLCDSVSLGIAGDLYFKTGASLNIRLPQAPTTSTLSFGATVRLAVAPQAGLNFQASQGLDFTVDYLGARDYRQEVAASNLIYLLGAGNAGLVQLGTTGSVYYDPETYSLGVKIDLSPEAKAKSAQILLGVDYERWSPYDGTIAKITFSTFTTQFIQNSSGISFRDVIVPRIGLVVGESIRWRAGYSYHTTPVVDLNSATNELDANKHIVAAGASFSIGTLGLFETPARMDLGAQVHVLVPRTVNKTDPNAIGAPGYTVSGTAYFYGIGLSHDI